MIRNTALIAMALALGGCGLPIGAPAGAMTSKMSSKADGCIYLYSDDAGLVSTAAEAFANAGFRTTDKFVGGACAPNASYSMLSLRMENNFGGTLGFTASGALWMNGWTTSPLVLGAYAERRAVAVDNVLSIAVQGLNDALAGKSELRYEQ